MKGIILAGGSGTRLHPITRSISKQLVPVYDKPMIYYPLSTLMMAGIQDILIITTPHDQEQFRRLLGNGSDWGINLSYAVQPAPEGLAQAFIIGANHIGSDSVALVLGDNIFHGAGVGRALRNTENLVGGRIFAHRVIDPSAYGVVEFDDSGKAISIEEKPTHPKSSYAVPGLYFYDNQVVEIAQNLKPSSRGELEITAVNAEYLRRDQLMVSVFPRGTAWFDTGTFSGLMQASQFVAAVENQQDFKIGCLEEIAWRNGWIDHAAVTELAQPLMKSGYGDYLMRLLSENNRGQEAATDVV